MLVAKEAKTFFVGSLKKEIFPSKVKTLFELSFAKRVWIDDVEFDSKNNIDKKCREDGKWNLKKDHTRIFINENKYFLTTIFLPRGAWRKILAKSIDFSHIVSNIRIL